MNSDGKVLSRHDGNFDAIQEHNGEMFGLVSKSGNAQTKFIKVFVMRGAELKQSSEIELKSSNLATFLLIHNDIICVSNSKRFGRKHGFSKFNFTGEKTGEFGRAVAPSSPFMHEPAELFYPLMFAMDDHGHVLLLKKPFGKLIVLGANSEELRKCSVGKSRFNAYAGLWINSSTLCPTGVLFVLFAPKSAQAATGTSCGQLCKITQEAQNEAGPSFWN